MKNEQKILFLLFRDAIESFMLLCTYTLSNFTIIVMSQYSTQKFQGVYLLLSNKLYVPAIKKQTHWSQAFVWQKCCCNVVLYNKPQPREEKMAPQSVDHRGPNFSIIMPAGKANEIPMFGIELRNSTINKIKTKQTLNILHCY